MDCKKVKTNIQKELKKYIVANKIKSLVLGVSGGIDSAIVAALAYPVCKELGIKLYGRSIPILTNKMDEIDRAQKIGHAFCMDFKEVDIGRMFHDFNRDIEDEEGCLPDGRRDKIRQGNIKARMRMIYLYNLAFTHEGMVLGTDNLTELNLGFWTLHGDVGDFGMIQNLWKGEVYELATYIGSCLNDDGKTQESDALLECINAVPTDGLGVTSSDLEQLGASSYKEVDMVLKGWLNKTCEKTQKEAEHPCVQRHIASMFKRNNPYNIPRGVLMNESA